MKILDMIAENPNKLYAMDVFLAIVQGTLDDMRESVKKQAWDLLEVEQMDLRIVVTKMGEVIDSVMYGDMSAVTPDPRGKEVAEIINNLSNSNAESVLIFAKKLLDIQDIKEDECSTCGKIPCELDEPEGYY